jgi:hypothetical protein
MSASAFFSSAALGRPFIFSSSFPSSLFEAAKTVATSARAETIAKNASTELMAKRKKTAEILAHVGTVSKLPQVVPASRLDVRPVPEMVSSGISQLDLLAGGFPRGCLTEICGVTSSGRTSVLLFALARATERGEVCALVDASDAFDPASAAAAGMELSRMLWVRCAEKHFSKTPFNASSRGTEKNPEARRGQARLARLLKVTDLLLQSNGFGMIALDLGDIPVQSARRIPLASWFRFRRAVEHTPTVLLVLEQQPIAGSCSSLLLKVSALRAERSNLGLHSELPHSKLLDQFEITAEVLRSRLERKLERKPVQSTRANFRCRAAWTG